MSAMERVPIITGILVGVLIATHLLLKTSPTATPDLYCLSPFSFMEMARKLENTRVYWMEELGYLEKQGFAWLSSKFLGITAQKPVWSWAEVIPLLLSPYTHVQAHHLILNLSALIHYGRLWERRWGSIRFFLVTFFFAFLIVLLEYGLIIGLFLLNQDHFISLPKYIDINGLMFTCSVGYSGVLYFLMTMDALATGNYHYPLLAMAVTHFTHEHIATFSHLAGIILGFLVHRSIGHF